MKIVIATLNPPFPPLNGYTNTAFNWIKQLSKAHTVCSIFFENSILPDPAGEHLNRYCEDICQIPNRIPNTTLKKVKGLLSKNPSSFSRYDWNAFVLALRSLAKDKSYQSVVFLDAQFLQLGENLASIGMTSVSSPLDLISLNLKRRIPFAPLPLKVYYKIESIKWSRVFRRLAINFDGIVLLNQEEVYLLRTLSPSMSDGQVRCISYGVDTEYYRPNDTVAGKSDNNAKPSLIFSGSMKSEQSETAIKFFLPIFEKLQEEYPSLQWYIVGRSPTSYIRQIAASNDSIHVTGFVDDVREYIQNATISIVPMQTGTGVKARMLEAMSMGKAIVATSLVASALNGIDPLPIAKADSAETFEKEIVKLLNDPLQRQQYGEMARNCVVEHFSWESSSKQLEAYLEELV